MLHLVFTEFLEVCTTPQQMAISPTEMTQVMASVPTSKLIGALTNVVREGLVRLLLITVGLVRLLVPVGELLLHRWGVFPWCILWNHGVLWNCRPRL